MAPERPGEVQRIAIDSSKAGSELGWRPAVDLDEGLRRTVAWFRERSPA
jgi:UDP-glucose 4-epimerase